MAKLNLEAICNPGKQYYYICPTLKQAKDIVWNNPEMMNSLIPEQAIERVNASELIIFYKNKAQIHIKGGDNPDSLKGMNPFGVILDEFATMKPSVYNEVIFPVINANDGWCWRIGTPKGKNHLWQAFMTGLQNPDKYQCVHMQASTAGILTSKQLENAKITMIDKLFRQEYECEWFDNEGTVFRRIKENIAETLAEPSSDSMYIMGVDLARHQDWTVITVVDFYKRKVVYVDRFNQIEYPLQKARIEAISRRYGGCEIVIDATGVGDPICSDLQAVGLAVTPYVFTNQSKLELIHNLSLLLEQDRIKIPNFEPLIFELQNFNYEMSKSGKVIYSAPEGLHDDCVMSLALASWKLSKDLHIATPEALLEQSITYNEYGEPVLA